MLYQKSIAIPVIFSHFENKINMLIFFNKIYLKACREYLSLNGKSHSLLKSYYLAKFISLYQVLEY